MDYIISEEELKFRFKYFYNCGVNRLTINKVENEINLILKSKEPVELIAEGKTYEFWNKIFISTKLTSFVQV